MYVFSSRVSVWELIEILTQLNLKDYSLYSKLKEYIEYGEYQPCPFFDMPNIQVPDSVFQLTDEGIYHHRFDTNSDEIIGRNVVRRFFLRKFGQEYLDYLCGPNVAVLTEDFIKENRNDKQM